MREQVDGTWYDTESAPAVAHRAVQRASRGLWVTMTHSIHRTRRGAWFVVDWESGSIQPVSQEAAMEWMRHTATGHADERLWARYGPGETEPGTGAQVPRRHVHSTAPGKAP